MKTLLTIICVTAVIAAAIHFWAAPGPTHMPVSASAQGPMPSVPATPPADHSTPADTPLASAAAAGQEQAPPLGDVDPMLVMALGHFSDEEIARYNELHILPFNPAVGEECEELPDPNFSDRTYTACRTVREFPEHPYTQLDTPALMELAVHDAVAALMLGRRVRQEQARLSWYLRAAALSGKSGPLMSLAENRYNSAYQLQSTNGKLQPVLQPDRIAVRIALDTVAAKMGDPRANPERWQQVLRDAPVEDPQRYLTHADDLAHEFLESMARTQREITGSVQIQEIIDHV